MSESPITILHIDDNEANLYVIGRMLRTAGCRVMEAMSGEAGLELVASQPPDLIILDVQLPDINGFEVCQRIKSNSKTASIPVLHLSASFVESRDKAQGLESGADGYLVQPVEPMELIATVKSLLRIRRAEESALSLAKEWQTTFDSISDGIGLLDEEGRFLRCNTAMVSLLGKPLSEIIGNLHQQVTQTLLSSLEATPFRKTKENRCRESIEVKSNNNWFSVTVDPVFKENYSFAGAVYILTDITNRKQVEAALQASEERFRLLLENVKDYAIFFLDNQGIITSWSAGAERLLGYQEAEILGQPGSCIFTPEDLEQGEDKKEFSKALAEGRAENERWHIRKDKSRFWGSGIVTPLRNETGQVQGFCKIMRDFTDRKQAEDERNQLLAREQEARTTAEAANRLKDEFLTTLSHELRSPLNSILGWIRLLNTRKFDEVTTARAMETIERNAKAQVQLVEDLLDVSRIIRGKLQLNLRPIQLIPVIEAAIETVRPTADAKQIQIETVFDSQAGLVAGDPDRLQQVVWNLLSNAIKFTLQGGYVIVRLERVDSHAEITVTDTGQGISPEFVPYVFDRFRQADSSTTRKYSGLGLGLAIVRQLVELHGGIVHAFSEGLEKGATFKVKLPLVPDSVGVFAVGNREENAKLLPVLKGVRTLIVDDETDSREFLVAALEEFGVQTIAVASAGEALKALLELKPDILISDIGMPFEDGYSLIHKVRQLTAEQGGQIPAIALTAYARDEDREQAISSGFQTHVSKPVEPDELAIAVANLLLS
ncbi:response regulator [Scytonema sp. UIC 10036]|uniref:hybrid sensor histidine kinase/response regulator n=1 Tax=Scytonema sp. UIC 10036 TaxID=2304196 RepID=UPI0012DA386F|nr:response regulator [Scytonema sp. UIC 10036]MUG97220.1 response regulator [Scytonema sp. UIC 10036]